MKYLMKILAAASLLFLVIFQNPVDSGTVDSASLTPASAIVQTGATHPLLFSATNNKAFNIKTYHAEFKYTAGLSVAIQSTTPPAAIAQVNASRKLIIIEWSALAPGQTAEAAIAVVSEATGTFTVTPSRFTYTDYNKKTYTGACNAAQIIIHGDLIAPAAPRNARSDSGEGFIRVSWAQPADSDVTGYNIYRRPASSGISSYIAHSATAEYRDATVEDGKAYYYKVTAVDASGNESAFSSETAETYFALKIRSYAAAASASSASVGDMNGDGLPDLIIGFPAYTSGKGGGAKANIGKVEVYSGGNTTGTPDVTLIGEFAGDQFGNSVAVADLNNDGYDDIVVGAPNFDPYLITPITGTAWEAGKVYVYAGGAQFSNFLAMTKNGTWSLSCDGSCYYLTHSENLGYSSAAAGDLNRDGYQDVIVGAPYGGKTLDRSGRILMLYGGPNLSSLQTAESWGRKAWSLMGTAVAAAGPVIVGAPGDLSSYHYGAAYLFADGNPVLSTGIKDDGFGNIVSSAGDMNGDGYVDIAVGNSLGMPVRVYAGGPSMTNEPAFVLHRDYMGNFAASLGDIDHDGYDDLLTNGPTVYFGNAAGDNIPDIVRADFGVLGAGDLNGDGIKEIIMQDAAGIHVLSLAPYLTLPAITIETPHDHAYIMVPTLAIRGRVSGPVIRVMAGGQAVPVLPDGAFSADVPLAVGDNIIEILAEAADGGIGKRTVTVTHALPPPLTVAVLSPADNAVVYGSPVTVSGSVNDPAATVLVNGITSNVTGTSFTAAGIALTEGANVITASAADNYGQTDSQSVTVTLLTKGTIEGVVTDASTGTPLAGVTVSIADTLGVHTVATAAGGAYTVSGVTQGNFTATFSKPGYITRVENGALAAGQTLTLDALLAAIPPLSLAITSPANGAVVATSSLSVSGLVSNSASVTVNGDPATVTGSAFSTVVPIRAGGNTVTAAAADQYGQTASQTISVTLAGLLDGQELFVSQLSLSFPDLQEGQSWSLPLTLTNIGTDNLVIGAMSRQALPFWLAANDCSGRTLAPAASCSLSVNFAPPAEGTFTRTLLIPSNDADHPNFSVTLNGTAAAYPGYVLPDTGQQSCTGTYQRNPLSYAPQGDGTVIDNNTGLQWEQQDDDQGRAWTDAGAYCGGLVLGGQGGWRLPTRNELLSIVDYGKQQPAVDPAAFPATDPASYWSSTESIADAWTVDFASGSASLTGKAAQAAVRCVRGAQLPDGPLWDNGDATETDLVTGLMWTRGLSSKEAWETARYFCDEGISAGYSDWRMPTIKELASRYEIGSENNCYLGDCTHWTSTSLAGSSCSQAFTTGSSAGILAEAKTNQHFLRCVRGGRTSQAATAPVITSVAVSGLTLDSATVSWTTDQPADSLIEYGTTAAYGGSAIDPTSTTSHSITLTGLAQSTTYHFRVSSSNSAGLSASTADSVFSTRAEFTATTIGEYGSVTVMEVAGNYDARKADGTINSLPRREIAKEFLRQHPDEYDFLIILSNFDFNMPQPEAKAFYLEVKNDTQGIGKTVFDDSAAFGSSGKLQGTIDMGNIANLGVSPLDPVKFEQALDLLAHEQLHRWAAGVKFKNADGSLNTALLGKDGTHWSYLLDSDGSLEYGNDWKSIGNGTFTSVSASKYYSNLDLYLMGMIDKSLVPSMTLIENAGIDPTLLPSLGTTITGTARTVTIDDIIAAEGERAPNAAASQKTFKTGFILITQPATFSGTEPGGIETLRNAWAGRFASLTGGKGSIAEVTPSLTVTITSPAESATITRPDITVKGAIINSTGKETGVVVNGIVAILLGNQFIAEHVPFAEGTNTITAIATDAGGNTATSTVTVTAATTENYIRLSPNITSGIAPLEVTIRIDGSFTITNSNLFSTGPGPVEYLPGTAVDEYKVRMTAEGIYSFTAEVTDDQNNTYTDAIEVVVQNRAALDALLKAKWEGMKTALLAGNIEDGVSYFAESSKSAYRQQFTILADQMPQIVADMGPFRMTNVREYLAEYDLRADRGGTIYSYQVLFMRDLNGIWKIRSF